EAITLACEYDHPDSYKCIFLASYRNLGFKVNWIDSSVFEDKTNLALQLPNSDQYPVVYDGDFTISGGPAVLTFLNIKGGSPSIHPRKARMLAQQQYWLQVLSCKVEPYLLDLSEHEDQVTNVMVMFNEQLEGKDYVINEFSLADIYWYSIFKYLEMKGHERVYKDYKNIEIWLDHVKRKAPEFEEYIRQNAA
ncbi:MAG: glutathione binding-like protein, partial [Pseudomonadota bacterium]